MTEERTRQDWEECTINDSWAVELFDEMLDEVYETVTLGSLEWEPSQVLAELDPIAYRCAFNDWTDSMAQDAPERTFEKYCPSCDVHVEVEEDDSGHCEDCGHWLEEDEPDSDPMTEYTGPTYREF